MSENIVRFREVERVSKRVRLRPDRAVWGYGKKHKWLQRFLLRRLRNLGTTFKDEVISYQEHTFKPSTFMENLFRQRAHILKQFSRDTEALLIGAKDFAELMGDPEIRSVVEFRAEYHNRVGRITSIHGIRCIIIPWMEGVVVLPKEAA